MVGESAIYYIPGFFIYVYKSYQLTLPDTCIKFETIVLQVEIKKIKIHHVACFPILNVASHVLPEIRFMSALHLLRNPFAPVFADDNLILVQGDTVVLTSVTLPFTKRAR